MAKAILTDKPGSSHDDLAEVRYSFPRIYLRQVEAAVGEFVSYSEPRRLGVGDQDRSGRQSYVAIARVEGAEAVPRRADHFGALVEPGSFIVFDRAVPFFEGGRFYERILMRGDGKVSKGAFGRAVRALPEAEFTAILAAGFQRELDFPESEWDLPEQGDERRIPLFGRLERLLLLVVLDEPGGLNDVHGEHRALQNDGEQPFRLEGDRRHERHGLVVDDERVRRLGLDPCRIGGCRLVLCRRLPGQRRQRQETGDEPAAVADQSLQARGSLPHCIKLSSVSRQVQRSATIGATFGLPAPRARRAPTRSSGP
jgi:hypothetical protein